MNRDISDVRHEYSGHGIDPDNTPGTPFPLFSEWLRAALEVDSEDANAMTLATVDAEGTPHARIVLLKGFDESGMVFYTNYQSHKGSELEHAPKAALVFWWPKLSRQVRIEGAVERVEAELSDQYFASRPRDSQLGAWVSQQSVEIPDRRWLEERWNRFAQAYRDQPVERPPHWGGLRLVPELIEFWQGQSNRLHDRVRYHRQADGDWRRVRLAP